MTDLFSELPPEIASKVLECLREVNGEYEVHNMDALLELIVKCGTDYPALRSLMNINEEVLIQHYQKTGEVPAGVKLVEKTTQ